MFLFFPTKNLGALGDAGAVVCHDEAVATRVKRLRQYGWDQRRVSVEPGINSRLDELQAAILRVKLLHLDYANAARVLQADRYRTAFKDLPIGLPSLRHGALHTYHLFVLRVNYAERDSFMTHLASRGVGCGIHYPVPVHKMPGFLSSVSLPVSEAIVKEIVSIPLFPGLSIDQQDNVISGVSTFYA